MNYAKRTIWAVLAAVLMFASVGQAREGEKPYSWTHPTKNTPAELARLQLPAVDRAARLQEDARVANPAAGAFEKRLRIGTDQSVQAQPKTDGTWETLPDGRRLWRLVVSSANATDLRFGFSSFRLPKGAMLTFVDNAGHSYDGPYDDTDATADGQFWTAPIAGSEITLELLLPANTELADGALVLSSVSTGYRDIMARDGKALLAPTASGTCNIDVVCPLGDNYRNEIRAVAKYTFSSSGSTFLCTGTLVMNTARDFRPFFLTANHCISTQTEASTIALIWNYQSPTCGQHGGGSTAQTQTGGTTLRAHRADVDFTLVELNQMPPASYNVYYAGWDVSGIAPGGSIGIHHPSGDVKAITQGIGTLPTINSCIGTGGVATHWRTGAPYSQGTTEGGSSGSAILVPHGDPNGHQNLIVGTLSGGDAACSGSVPNNGEDCYGKLSVSFNGSSSASRLKDWLDPGSTGVTILAGAPPPSQTSSATTISGSPLTVIVGRDHSFQILNSAIPGVGQVYPSTSSGPADMGWFVRTASTLYSPDFSSHGGTATGNLGTRTAYTPQSLSGVTGTGSTGNPFTVSVGGALGSSGLVATEQVTYASGSNFFTKRFTLKNNGSTSQTVKIFLGADIYLAGSDSGVPFRIASSGTTGGQNCANPANYSILFIPQTTTDGYTGASYSSVWSQIGAGTLNNALSSGCIDNGVALQWNRTIAAGASVTIQAATSFGDIPSTFLLSVAKAGSGSGTVTSNPAGISCGATCTANFFSGNTVTLTATPASGSTFAGWSGSCTGTGTCTVTMTAARSVTATFNAGISATLRFDTSTGPISKTIVRNSGTPVTFAWKTTALPAGTTCRIYLRPNNTYQAAATPTAGGSRTDTTINGWGTGAKVFYLGCTNGTSSANITLNIVPPPSTATLRFDSASGPAVKTIVRNSGTSVKFFWVTSVPAGTTCKILLRPNNTYQANATPVAAGSRTDTGINGWATGAKVFYLGCSNGTNSPDITLNIVPAAGGTASLRFDSASGPTTKTIMRNSGTPVKFFWVTSLPTGTTCKILLRPNNTYQANASPVAAGNKTDTSINSWGSGAKVFYLGCNNGTNSPDITLTILPPAG